MTVCDDPTDPAQMTPDERLDEVAAIFAEGVRRLRQRGAIMPHDAASEIPPDSADSRLAGGKTLALMDNVVNGSREARERRNAMPQDMRSQIAALRKMTPGQLREKYFELFGEPSRSGNKDFLFKRLAWRIQSLAEGGLSERALRRATELARDADIRMTMPRVPKAASGTAATATGQLVSKTPGLPMPGAVITRDYRGQKIEVTVLPKGFEWQGEVYRSLTAVAKAVTGSHWNGHLFFGLRDGAAK